MSVVNMPVSNGQSGAIPGAVVSGGGSSGEDNLMSLMRVLATVGRAQPSLATDVNSS